MLMEISMREIGKMTKLMDMALTNILMVQSMRANG